MVNLADDKLKDYAVSQLSIKQLRYEFKRLAAKIEDETADSSDAERLKSVIDCRKQIRDIAAGVKGCVI